jgi:hypothetical protein
MNRYQADQPNYQLSRVWHQILDWENLLLAYRKARRGKPQQAEILDFGFNLEYELSAIRQELMQHTYQPGGSGRFVEQQSTEPAVG